MGGAFYLGAGLSNNGRDLVIRDGGLVIMTGTFYLGTGPSNSDRGFLFRRGA